jgi:hypothetical protein
MAQSNKPRTAVDAGRRASGAGVRRRFAWLISAALALALYAPSPSQGQFRGTDWSAPPTGGVPIVLAEHGESSLFIPLGTTVVGLAIFDIATAAASADAVNARRESGFRSPGTAFAVSAAATVVPLVLAFTGFTESPEMLIVGGIVVGPSVGHVYAGRPGRALLTAALRAGLGMLALSSVLPST